MKKLVSSTIRPQIFILVDLKSVTGVSAGPRSSTIYLRGGKALEAHNSPEEIEKFFEEKE